MNDQIYTYLIDMDKRFTDRLDRMEDRFMKETTDIKDGFMSMEKGRLTAAEKTINRIEYDVKRLTEVVSRVSGDTAMLQTDNTSTKWQRLLFDKLIDAIVVGVIIGSLLWWFK